MQKDTAYVLEDENGNKSYIHEYKTLFDIIFSS